MKIYKVTFYNLVDKTFYEGYHKNFQHLEDAKKYIKTYAQEFKRIFKDDNVHVMEYDYKEDNRHYLVDLDRDVYTRVVRERLDIVEEQVY